MLFHEHTAVSEKDLNLPAHLSGNAVPVFHKRPRLPCRILKQRSEKAQHEDGREHQYQRQEHLLFDMRPFLYPVQPGI